MIRLKQYAKEKYIYRIINLVNGKCYIGQSSNPKQRFLEHTRKACNTNEKMKRAVAKYGRQNFKMEFLYHGKDYNEQEKFFIEKYNSIKEGYNIAKGGNEPPPKKGERNQNAKLKESEVKEIQQLLLTDTPKKEILKKFPQVRMDQINRINNGRNWKDENLQYPLRNNEYNISFSQVEKIVEDIKETDMSLKEIGAKYGLCKSSIVNINNGYNSQTKKLSEVFPIRKQKNKKTTIEQVLRVKELLMNTNFSYEKIEQETNMSYDCILSINVGRTYYDENLNYPIRNKKNNN